jgi:hypothetical protein
LVVALVMALIFGAGCWTEGCKQLAFYRGERAGHLALNGAVLDAEDRAHVETFYARFVDASDASRGRGVPLAAAIFVLGAALLALAARGLAGKSNPRSALLQVVAAQAALVLVAYFALANVRNTELDWDIERRLVLKKADLAPDEYEQMVATARAARRWVPPAWLVFRTAASLLILLALTRPRARAFFEAAASPVSE